MIKTIQEDTIIKAVGLTRPPDDADHSGLLGHSRTTHGWGHSYYIHASEIWYPIPDNFIESAVI